MLPRRAGPDFVLVAQAPDMASYDAVVQRLFTQDANVRNVKAYFSVRAPSSRLESTCLRRAGDRVRRRRQACSPRKIHEPAG